MKKLPDTMMIGAATAAHQVEGNNVHSDCWAMEQLPHSAYKVPSGICDDHYNRYREDIRLLAQAGLNAYRFSIEWARIEPEEGKFDEAELRHYGDVLSYCRELGVEPIVTLHHFSSPKWLIGKGGWKSEDTVAYFARYCGKVAETLGEKMSYVCTINEANMGLQMNRVMQMYAAMMAAPEEQISTEENGKEETASGDIQVGVNMDFDVEAYMREAAEAFGCDPMKISQFLDGRSAEEEKLVMRAHQAARVAIKKAAPYLKVGLTLSLYDYQPQAGGETIAEELWNEDFGIYRPWLEEDDFIGVQNYTRKIISAEGPVDAPEQKNTAAGYEFYPYSIGGVIRHAAQSWNKDILVTENGVSTADDEERETYIMGALEEVADCIEEGIPVKGYLHWSLLDNFEWQLGFDQTYGLIAVDRTTLERTPKPSLSLLGKISRTKNVGQES